MGNLRMGAPGVCKRVRFRDQKLMEQQYVLSAGRTPFAQSPALNGRRFAKPVPMLSELSCSKPTKA
eukprot:10971535-Lingulodinium_polyedra.AAC.1